MTDIVDDLREYADASNYPATMLDAAAEIARLKAEVERLKNLHATGVKFVAEYDKAMIDIRTENERLRAALDTANANCDRMASLAIDNAKDTERLRAALRDVIGWLEDPEGGNHEEEMREASKIARAALTQHGGER